jgi:uncharacterized membrane protein
MSRTLRLLVVLSAVSVALLGWRATHPWGFGFDLAWNLFLAWFPFVFALALVRADERDARPLTLVALGIGWLLFLPNAPYILTDFIYVHDLGYDAVMTATFAATGVLLGLVSLRLVSGVVSRRRGRVAGLLLLPPAFVLASAGVVLGRVYRLNSWDAITRPSHVLGQLVAAADETLDDPRVLAAFVGMVLFLSCAYALLAISLSGRAGERAPARRIR